MIEIPPHLTDYPDTFAQDHIEIFYPVLPKPKNMFAKMVNLHFRKVKPAEEHPLRREDTTYTLSVYEKDNEQKLSISHLTVVYGLYIGGMRLSETLV